MSAIEELFYNIIRHLKCNFLIISSLNMDYLFVIFCFFGFYAAKINVIIVYWMSLYET